MHTHTHARRHSLKHAHTRTLTHALKHTVTHAHTLTHTHTRRHSLEHAHTLAHTRSRGLVVYMLFSRWHLPSLGRTMPPSFPSPAKWKPASVEKTSSRVTFLQPIWSYTHTHTPTTPCTVVPSILLP